MWLNTASSQSQFEVILLLKCSGSQANLFWSMHLSIYGKLEGWFPVGLLPVLIPDKITQYGQRSDQCSHPRWLQHVTIIPLDFDCRDVCRSTPLVPWYTLTDPQPGLLNNKISHVSVKSGQLLTVHISLTYKGINSSLPMQLTREERGNYIASVLRSMNRLLSISDPIWSREHHQFSRYTDLLVRLREDTCLLLYSYTGTLVSIPMFCRTVEEAEEVWQRYNSGSLECEIRKMFEGLYLPFGPVETTIKIYDYEECKRNFQFAGLSLALFF